MNVLNESTAPTKVWFKYEFGFVNVLDNDIYLTNTGNWSEVEHLTESVPQSRWSKAIKLISSSTLALGIGFICLLYDIISWKSLYFLTFLAPLLWSAYTYYKPEIGDRFKIPYAKLNDISSNGNHYTLHFTNAIGAIDTYKLINLSPEGQSYFIQFIENKRSE